MKVKDMITLLQKLPPEYNIVVSSDEELNTLYEKFEIALLDDNEIVIYGLSGSEIDE
jgi:predicted glycosyltransferase